MKTAFKIAKAELSTLFYSPIAWFLSIVFLFQCGLFYTSAIQNQVTAQQLGGWYLDNLNFSTFQIFGYPRGLFADVLRKVYLYLPLLTMGLVSREISSGTIKLLFSSPVKIRDIVSGKFMAMMAYNFVLILILVVFVIVGLFNIHAASGELGTLASGLLGIFLLLCTYAAIGLFMSCLTSYQVVAAISTLVIFAVLNYVGQIWQGIDFVRDLTNFLSISRRAERMIFGLISTKDVLYFLLIIAVFLGFSFVKLQSGRESKSAFRIAGRYISIFAIALIIGYITSLPGFIGYYDATPAERLTLTPNAKKTLLELGDETLEVTAYVNLLDQNWFMGKPDQRNNFMDVWENYLRFKPDIKFKFVYYWDVTEPDNTKYYPGKTLKQIAEQFSLSWKVDLDDFRSPEEMKKIIDLRPELNRFVMQLKYKGKTTFLRTFDDQVRWPTEPEFSAAFKRLTTEKLPKVLFAQGEYERDISKKGGNKSYGLGVTMVNNRGALVNQGFNTDTITLQDREIPKDITVLVIADPRAKFTPEVLSKIQHYIAEGGNLLIAGEPGKQDILDTLVRPMGVQFNDGMLLQNNNDYSQEVVTSLLTKTSAGLSASLGKFFEDSTEVLMSGAVGLHYNSNGPFDIKPLLVTDGSKAWNKKGKPVLDSAAIGFSLEDGDEKKPFPTLLGLTRKINGKEQRIIISGDADFISNGFLYRSMANRDLAPQLFKWFTYGEFPINTDRPASKDKKMNITDKGVPALKIFFLGFLPGLLLIFAAVFLIRRKRK